MICKVERRSLIYDPRAFFALTFLFLLATANPLDKNMKCVVTALRKLVLCPERLNLLNQLLKKLFESNETNFKSRIVQTTRWKKKKKLVIT